MDSKDPLGRKTSEIRRKLEGKSELKTERAEQGQVRVCAEESALTQDLDGGETLRASEIQVLSVLTRDLKKMSKK